MKRFIAVGGAIVLGGAIASQVLARDPQAPVRLRCASADIQTDGTHDGEPSGRCPAETDHVRATTVVRALGG